MSYRDHDNVIFEHLVDGVIVCLSDCNIRKFGCSLEFRQPFREHRTELLVVGITNGNRRSWWHQDSLHSNPAGRNASVRQRWLNECSRFHLFEGDFNANLGKLRLDFLGYFVGVRQIGTVNHAEGQRNLERVCHCRFSGGGCLVGAAVGAAVGLAQAASTRVSTKNKLSIPNILRAFISFLLFLNSR